MRFNKFLIALSLLAPVLAFGASGSGDIGSGIPTTEKGAANGVATLDGTGKVPLAQIPGGGGGAATWGAITGTLSSQTDLQTALNAKQTIFAGTTLQYVRGDSSLATLNSAIVPELTNLYYTQARFDTAFTAKSTTNLSEGTNLYYTQGRFDTAFSGKSTTNLSEGTNLYFTNARAQGAVSATPPVVDTAGVFSMAASTNSVDGYLTAADHTTFAAKEPAISAGTTLQYWRGDKSFQTLNTAIVPESSNLYFTNARAQGAVSATPPIVDTAGVFSMPAATNAVDGYLTALDHLAFSTAQSALTPGHDLWIDRNGSDSANCSIAAPCQTVGHALTLVTSPSSTNNWTIHLLSGRHDQETNDLLITPYTFIVGSSGPDVAGYLRLPAGKAIKLGAGFTSNSRAGLQNLYLGGGTSVNLDYAAAGGSAGSNFMLDDVFVTGTLTHTGRGANGGDFLYVQNSFMFGATSLTGSELQSLNSTWGSSITAATGTTVQSDLTFIGGSVSGAFAFTQGNGQTANLSTSGTQYLGTFTTTGTIGLTADLNLPIGYSLSGGTTRTNTASAAGVPFTPGTSGNWNSVPTLVSGALDTLASSGVVKSQSQNLVLASPNGSSGVMTPRALVAGDLPAGTGTVTSVAASVPSIFSIAGTPITTSGTLAMTYSGTALPVANGGTNSTAALNNNRVMQSSGSAVVEAAAITASRALVSDANGIPTHSATTATELGYVSGVTSALQTQINAKFTLPSFTTGSVPVSNGTTLVEDNTNFFFDTTNHSLSVGPGPHPATSADLAISSQVADTKVGLSVYSVGSNNAVQIQNQSGFSLATLVADATNSPSINFERARGTLASKTQALAGDTLGSFVFNGYTGSADGAFAAAFGAVATENQASGHAGATLAFQTTPNSSSTLVSRMTIGQDGVVNITNLTASRAMATDASKNLVSSATTGTELGYLSGVTSAVQTQINAKQNAKMSVVDGGNAAYTILSTDDHVRSTTTLTADRAYTLPACVSGNVGERHEVKNLPAQTFNITLTAAGSDTIDGNATMTIYPGQSFPVVCGAAAVWDIQ